VSSKALCNAAGVVPAREPIPKALNEADHDGPYAFHRLGHTQEDDRSGDGGGNRGRGGAVLRYGRQHA
jgi:hypothetical protein